VGEVRARDLHLDRLLVKESLAFLLGELLDRLVRVEARSREHAHVPAVGRVAGDRDGALIERLGVVKELCQIDIADRSHPLASRAHAAGDGEDALLGLARALLDRD
jgi:hypothetical protein